MNPENTEKDKGPGNNGGQVGLGVVETNGEGKSNVVRNVVLGATGATVVTSLTAAGVYAKKQVKFRCTRKKGKGE